MIESVVNVKEVSCLQRIPSKSNASSCRDPVWPFDEPRGVILRVEFGALRSPQTASLQIAKFIHIGQENNIIDHYDRLQCYGST